MSRAIAKRRLRALTWVLVGFSWSGATVVWLSLAAALLVARARGVDLIPQQTMFLSAMLASLFASVTPYIIIAFPNASRVAVECAYLPSKKVTPS